MKNFKDPNKIEINGNLDLSLLKEMPNKIEGDLDVSSLKKDNS